LFPTCKITKTLGTAAPATDAPLIYRIAIRANAERPLVGSTIFNRYYLLAVIGIGGMSVVYKAKDLKQGFDFRREFVAIKTLNYKWSNDGLTVKRFEREAKVLGMLNHPGIVHFEGYNETEDGQPFFVMDYLQGITLANLIKSEGILSTTTLWKILSQVFDAVEHAHNYGLVHRDLKPSNIMLVKQANGRQRVKVVDFGVAKLQQEAQKLTRLGEVWGSPIYMSPEQCVGAEIDHRSDIYSLAVTIYECLSGQLPFLGESYFETMSKKINLKARRLSEACPQLNFTDELDRVLSKALEKEPKQRFQNMPEFRQALHNALTGSSSSTRLPKTFPVIVKKPHSNQADQHNLKQKLRLFLARAPKSVIAVGVAILVLLLWVLRLDYSKGNVSKWEAQTGKGSAKSRQRTSQRL
jgi:eukaryotic-like serine/threonine-protein kinase